MSFKHVDIESALRRLAERRIEDAMKEGNFDNLAGAGKPLDLEPIPADENARLTSWALRILKQNDVIPDEVRWRKTLDTLRGELEIVCNEHRLRFLVEMINGLAHKINTLGTNALNSLPIAGVALESELERLPRANDSMTTQSLQLDGHALASEIKNRARRMGFDLVGIAPASASKYREYFRNWLDDGRAGTMEYLARRFEQRTNPASYLPDAKTVVCLATNYHVPLDSIHESERAHQAKIARYALGDDYHEPLKRRLWKLADWIRDTVPGARTRACVDTAPVLERELAGRAGIGWVGKNTCVINEEIGSWLLLAEIITTLDLPPDAPAADRCGSCTRCIDACPTGAITAPYELDARRCISYLTIEHDGPIPKEFERQVGEWLYGCDICQDVCPWNSKAPVSLDPLFQPRFKTGAIDPRTVMGWTEDEYRTTLRNSPMRRLKLHVLQRNAAITARNLRNWE